MKPTKCTLLLSMFISTFLYVSGSYVPIIRRIYCIYETLGFLHSLWVAVWSVDQTRPVYLFQHLPCFGQLCAHHQENLLYLWDTGIFALSVGGCLVCRPDQTSIFISTFNIFRSAMCPSSGEFTVCRPDSHPHRVQKYQCRIDIVNSLDDGHIAARNM